VEPHLVGEEKQAAMRSGIDCRLPKRLAVVQNMAEVSKSSPQPVRLHHWAWAAGIIGLPLSHYWLMAKIEPFYSSIYCFLWWSYIFAVDFVVCRLRGTSLLRDRPKEFLLLAIGSVPLWLFFEMVNLCIQNWYYVMVPWSFSWGMMFLVLAFGTVLPGIFETVELVVGVIEKLAPRGRIEGHPFAVNRWNVRIQCGVGVSDPPQEPVHSRAGIGAAAPSAALEGRTVAAPDRGGGVAAGDRMADLQPSLDGLTSAPGVAR